MTINLQKAISYEYPDYTINVNYRLSVDAYGNESISWWDTTAHPLPTQDELNSWWIAYLKETQKTAITNGMNLEFMNGFPSATMNTSFKLDLATLVQMTGEYSWLQSNPSDTPEIFKDAKNNDINMTRSQFFTVCGEARKFTASNKQREWKKHNVIDSCTTEDTILSIIWNDKTKPSVPTNLTASAIAGGFDFTWSANTDLDIDHYDFYKNGVRLGTVTQPTYQVTGLVTGTSYTFQVLAVDIDGNSSALCSPLTITGN